jgi:hypothetical protein
MAVDAAGRRDENLAALEGLVASSALAGKSAVAECAARDRYQLATLRFETIDARDEVASLRQLIAQDASRGVGFDWNAASGELTFDEGSMHTPLTPRGRRLSSTRLTPRTVSCESR